MATKQRQLHPKDEGKWTISCLVALQAGEMMRLLESSAAPYLGMVSATTAHAVVIIISKGALASGMTSYTLVAYSDGLAALLLLPLSLLVHKSSSRPPLSFLLVAGFFTLGFLGCLAQVFGYTGIRYSSAAFASAMMNLIPAFTFILAVLFRMEKVFIGNASFLAKAVGTIVAIVGALVVTLYKGPKILTLGSSQPSYVVAGLFLTADCVVASAFMILQTSILKKYPAALVIVFFYSLFAFVLSALISLIVDQDPSAWSLQPSIRLVTVLYSGIIGSGLQSSLTTWCVQKKGPLFVAMFRPLGIVISAVLGILFLGNVLYLGILLGSFVIVIWIYTVIWGKAKDANAIEDTRSSESTSMTSPLLPTKDFP